MPAAPFALIGCVAARRCLSRGAGVAGLALEHRLAVVVDERRRD